MNARVTTLLDAYRLLVLDLVYSGAFTLREFERASRFQFVKGVLELYHGNQSRAARACEIHRNTMRRLILEMHRAGITVELGRRRGPKRATLQVAGKRSA